MVTSVLLIGVFVGLLITLHEFGHLLVAKLSHIPVESFSIGFGPVVVKKKVGETEYRLSLIPLGGYIKMMGEEDSSAGGFSDKPLFTRIAVVAAGPFFNLILGFGIMVGMYLVFGLKYVKPIIYPAVNSNAIMAGLEAGDLVLTAANETIPDFERLERVLERNRGREINLKVLRDSRTILVKYLVPDSLDIEPLVPPVVDRVRSGSPAEKVGLKPGDRIVAIAGIPVKRWAEFVEVVMQNAGNQVEIIYERNGSLFVDSITPATVQDQLTSERFGQIGVWVRLPKRRVSFLSALGEATKRTGYIIVQTFVIIYKVITRQVSSRVIGGPIMVAQIAYEGASWGAEYFLALWALLSINLFVVNMLPVPVLDGGRILLDIIAGVRRRRLTSRELAWANNIGWILIGLLIIFTLYNDLLRLIRK